MRIPRRYPRAALVLTLWVSVAAMPRGADNVDGTYASLIPFADSEKARLCASEA